jgi:hypothetical protein
MYEDFWPKTGCNPSDLLKTTPRDVRGSVKVGFVRLQEREDQQPHRCEKQHHGLRDYGPLTEDGGKSGTGNVGNEGDTG